MFRNSGSHIGKCLVCLKNKAEGTTCAACQGVGWAFKFAQREGQQEKIVFENSITREQQELVIEHGVILLLHIIPPSSGPQV